jgi:hypothetical protein
MEKPEITEVVNTRMPLRAMASLRNANELVLPRNVKRGVTKVSDPHERD